MRIFTISSTMLLTICSALQAYKVTIKNTTNKSWNFKVVTSGVVLCDDHEVTVPQNSQRVIDTGHCCIRTITNLEPGTDLLPDREAPYAFEFDVGVSGCSDFLIKILENGKFKAFKPKLGGGWNQVWSSEDYAEELK